jgi:hydrogenase nickel incorporation protein HypA/HybF
MHELSIALSIVDVAAEEAQREGATRVAAVHLKLGPLSGVVKEALRSAYEMARAGSPLEDAELVINDVPIVVRCPECGGQRTVASMHALGGCPCGALAVEILSGRELEVVGLELEP